MPVSSATPADVGPLVVKPKVAWQMLSCSNTRGYELLAAGALDSFRDGRSRKSHGRVDTPLHRAKARVSGRHDRAIAVASP